ncbi:PWWP domain-containing protein 3-like [Primulina tabacum]|uniref:PWWP domain-containing protein 3-like n=1 Tax=Primulina tabacum TaxID=48773 RepID=UPI003F59791E
MATLEDVVAATQFLAKESETLVAGSGSDSRVRASDVEKVYGSASATLKNLNSISNGVTSVSVNGPSNGIFGGKSTDDSKQLKESGKKYSIGDVIDDKLEDGFRVGDFVWGKIRSHPWWPGQVHDPKDASEFAEKHSQEGCLLVAFFGDGSCSWCTPSQLIPFLENFEEMSKSGGSKSFLNAVKMALNEICRLVESEMSCKCTLEEIKVGLARPMVSNFGVKTGVLMPEFNFHPLFLGEYEPIKLFAKLRNFAEGISFASSFELAVLTSWISAFYRFKCGYPLSRYHRAFSIEGLEDEDKDEDEDENVAEVMNDITDRYEVPIKGPHSDYEIYRRRKQKSVAALMGEDPYVKPRSQEKVTVHEAVNLGKSRSSKKRKKSIDVLGEGGGQMDSSIGKTSGRKKVQVSVSSKVTSEEVVNAEKSNVKDVDNVNKGSSSRKRKKIKATLGEAKEESEWITTPRERKKSRFLSPPYTNIARRAVNTSSKREAEFESDKITKIAPRVRERIMKAAENLFESPPLPKMVDEAFEKEQPDKHLERHDMFDNMSHCTKNDKLMSTISDVNSPSNCTENDKLMCSMSDVNSPIDVILSEIKFTALFPHQVSDGGSLDIVRGFVSALRSSTYIEGSNYNIYQNCKKGKMKESSPAQWRNVGDDPTQKKTKSSGLKPSEALTMKTEETSGKSMSKKADETFGGKTRPLNVEEIDATRLILTFSPEYSLPSKKDILKIFSKYGFLNKKETNISKDSHSFQIVYVKDSDAEAAFKSSLSQSPFGKNVNYRLQCSSTWLRSHGSQGRVSSSHEQISKELDSSQPPDELMTEVSLIKQKFEIMTAILENYHLKFSLEEKSSLKDEMKRLVEMVETASEKVRIMAEGTKF